MRATSSYPENQISRLLETARSTAHLHQFHALLTKTGILHCPYLLLRLLSLSALSPFATLSYSLSLFSSLPSHLLSPSHFNVLIRAHSRSLFPFQSITLYNQMRRLGIPSDNLTLPFTLKALGRVPAVDPDSPLLPFARKGAEIHSAAFRLGFDADAFVANSLMFMYWRCGRLDDAQKVFDEMPEKTLVSWNTMLVAYERNRDFESVERILRLMPDKNVASWNSVITMHVRKGDVEAARRVFEGMPERDVVSWNSLIAGYIRVRNYGRALRLFRKMVKEKIEPTQLTVVSVLGACAETGGLEMGKEIHGYLRDRGIGIEGFVGNALLDMYAKCGSLKLARRVFDEMGMKHESCWNSMIVGLAVHGHCEEALELFASMEKEMGHGAKPNRVTFLGVLLACSHKGLVEDGRGFFRRMVEEYKIDPDIKHYGCMVDMFSRLGLLDEAYQMIKEMPIRANSVLWKTVLGACRVHGNVELAEEAFRELAKLGPLSDEHYVLMSNVFAEAGKWDKVEVLRCGMIGDNILKPRGFSQIELN